MAKTDALGRLALCCCFVLVLCVSSVSAAARREERSTAPTKVIALQDRESFDQVVLDKDKDVFVLFSSAWCAHCQRSRPAYEELANTYPDVVFAEFESNRHDPLAHRYNVKGFPTFLLFTKSDKSGRRLFHNARTVAKFTSFLDKELDREKSTDL